MLGGIKAAAKTPSQQSTGSSVSQQKGMWSRDTQGCREYRETAETGTNNKCVKYRGQIDIRVLCNNPFHEFRRENV